MTATSAEIAVASREFNRAADRLPTLFSMDDEMLEVVAVLESPDTDDEDVQPLEQRLERLAGALLQKVEHYGVVIRTLERLAEARKAEADRLRAKAKTSQDGAEWLRNRLLVHMKTMGQPRIETPRFTFTVRQNPESVTVVDEALVPAEFAVVTVTISKQRIKEHIKATGEIPAGIEITRGESLRIS